MRTTEQQTRDDKQPDIDTMRYDLAEREAMNMPVSEHYRYAYIWLRGARRYARHRSS